mmetsp:Transcript_48687/g.155585  ORF Transcript_48687/g.155585 Transcript_48687/m.155585 type:complete len:290 (-) Transcript_48687:173-1042(-)
MMASIAPAPATRTPQTVTFVPCSSEARASVYCSTKPVASEPAAPTAPHAAGLTSAEVVEAVRMRQGCPVAFIAGASRPTSSINERKRRSSSVVAAMGVPARPAAPDVAARSPGKCANPVIGLPGKSASTCATACSTSSSVVRASDGKTLAVALEADLCNCSKKSRPRPSSPPIMSKIPTSATDSAHGSQSTPELSTLPEARRPTQHGPAGSAKALWAVPDELTLPRDKDATPRRLGLAMLTLAVRCRPRRSRATAAAPASAAAVAPGIGAGSDTPPGACQGCSATRQQP